MCNIHPIDTFINPKKTAMNTPQKAKKQDWHRADIKAALEKAGWTLRKLQFPTATVQGRYAIP